MKKRRPVDTLTEVGERLKKVRKALKLNQIDLCNQINVATNTYNQWEKGKSLLDPLAAVRLAKHYGVTLDYLYRGELSGLPYYMVACIEGVTLAHSKTPKTEYYENVKDLKKKDV